jgi:hypothetical protein
MADKCLSLIVLKLSSQVELRLENSLHGDLSFEIEGTSSCWNNLLKLVFRISCRKDYG